MLIQDHLTSQSVMGRPGIQIWPWTLCVFLSWTSAGQAAAGPHYMVTVPAILEAGAQTKFCASLRQPNETLEMTVTLLSEDAQTILLKQTSSKEFHTCTEFQVSSPALIHPLMSTPNVMIKKNNIF
ncbi:uncharacterized protein LOC121939015 [Plectropomus leopardus]|uniref:uncharacterized protein LOC121939015 n=1 Tax=Plectropomus leopardus TaxID=160734 RepID=UPI001C4C11EB|nr:uncharacterized protein LOC121939015 [Plectropomus leopardus]